MVTIHSLKQKVKPKLVNEVHLFYFIMVSVKIIHLHLGTIGNKDYEISNNDVIINLFI